MRLAICFLLLMSFSPVWAQSLRSKSKTTLNSGQLKQKKYIDENSAGALNKQLNFHNGKIEKHWQIAVDLNASQKAIQDGSDRDRFNYHYSLSTETSLRLNDKMSLKGLLSFETYTKDELSNDVSDWLLSFYFYRAKIAPNLVFMPYLTATVPLSKDSRQRQQMNFGAGLGGMISGQNKLKLGTLTFATGASFHKYSHRYETALNNVINPSYSANQQVSTGWNYKEFALTGLFRHINSWNYAGAMAEMFIHMEAVGYSATDNLTFSLGHTNSGSVLSPNQEEVDIKLVDENNSTVFVSTTYVF